MHCEMQNMPIDWSKLVGENKVYESFLRKKGYDPIIGIWVKAKPGHIEAFLRNWEADMQSQAFCVYDSPPIVPEGGLVFMHAIGRNRLVAYAKYVDYEYIQGWFQHAVHRNDKLWISERDRIWSTYTPDRLHTRNKSEFERFWAEQMGVRGLFIMEELSRITQRVTWMDSMKILQVNRPLGFSYRYLTESQSKMFLQKAGITMNYEVKGINSPKIVWEKIVT